MRPARGVDLPGRNPHRAHCSHCKRRFLTAASESGLHRGKRRRCARVAGAIGGFLVQPVVHLERGIGHGEMANAWRKLAIEHLSGTVEVLIVHTHRQHKVAKFAFWHKFAPRHLGASLQSRLDVGGIEVARIIEAVGKRHRTIEKIEIFFHHLAVGICHRARSLRCSRKERENC